MGSAITPHQEARLDLHISISASSFSELLAGVTKLKADLEANGVTLGDVGMVSGTEISAKPRRTGNKKAATAAATAPVETPAPGIADNDPGDPGDAALAPQVPDRTNDTPTPATVNAVIDLSPEDARRKGIEEMQRYFGANPNAMPDIKRLQTKFGVKMFQDIPDDQAHAFYADVKLLASGNAQAA